jgi:hypothetical protein
MKDNLIECMAIALYLETAQKIIAELEKRGFTTDRPDDAGCLDMAIAEIIQQSIQGNTNYSEETPVHNPFECGCQRLAPVPPELELLGVNDALEGDLQNQGPPDDYPPNLEGDLHYRRPDYDEYPPNHPLEN